MGAIQERFVTSAQAAEMMELSDVRIRQFLNEGRFRGAEKIGEGKSARWIIPLKEVERVAKEERPVGRPKGS